MPIALGIIVVALVVYYFASRGDRRDGSMDEEEQLLQLCLGNREQAERLVALEMRKMPGIKRREAISRAIRSLRRDVR